MFFFKESCKRKRMKKHNKQPLLEKVIEFQNTLGSLLKNYPKVIALGNNNYFVFGHQ